MGFEGKCPRIHKAPGIVWSRAAYRMNHKGALLRVIQLPLGTCKTTGSGDRRTWRHLKDLEANATTGAMTSRTSIGKGARITMQEMTHRLTTAPQRLAFESHGCCASCGHRFKEGGMSHLGYGADDEPLYVCDGCSGSLKETATRQYFLSRPYDVPGPKSKLWRYMDFTKYVSLLSSRGLYFARADRLEDAFEGAKGLRRRKEKWDAHYLDFFRSAVENPPEGHLCKLSEEEIEREARRLLGDLETNGVRGKTSTFVSCWHESEHESEAMWRLYSNLLSNAVAVNTTYGSLYSALGRDPSIGIGRVRYIDMRSSYTGVNDAFWRKRKSFEHEKEVRALMSDYRCEEAGKSVPCDLETLIEQVFVSPLAPE